MTRRTLPLLLLAAVFAAACASPAATGGGPDDTVSTSIPPGSGGPPKARPTFMSPTPGLQNVLATSWVKAIPSANGMTLTVRFWGSPCLGVDHVDVKETPDRVALTLYQGTPPSMAGTACIEVAMLAAVRVDLSSPLGDRTVVDGTRHAGG